MNALAHTADKVYRLLYFPPAAEAEGHMLMSSIKAAFIENLKSVDWYCMCVCVCVCVRERESMCVMCSCRL